MPPRRSQLIRTPEEQAAYEAQQQDIAARIRLGKERERRRLEEEAEAAARRAADAALVNDQGYGPGDDLYEAPPPSVTELLLNGILALVFLSFPLSEPDIDWLAVGVMCAVNAFWNLFMHASTWKHLGILALINVVLVQYSDRFANLPMALWSIPPERMMLLGCGNAVVLFVGYVFFVRRAEPEQRVTALDWLLTGTLMLNVAYLVYVGTIGMAEVKSVLRGIMSLVADLPPPAEEEGQPGAMPGGGPDPTAGAGGAGGGPGMGGPGGPGMGGPGGPGGPGPGAGGSGGQREGPNAKFDTPNFPPGVDVEFF